MRTLLMASVIAGLLAVGFWLSFKDAFEMRTLIGLIEGEHRLDLVSNGRVEGAYVSEFKQLPDGGFLSRVAFSMTADGGLDLANDSRLEFSGFPFYSLRTVRTRQGSGDKDIVLKAADLPKWSLYEHLILQRIAIEGRAFLEQHWQGIELLEVEAQGSARFKAPVFDSQEAGIVLTEFEVDWRDRNGMTVHRQGGWIDFDRTGRIRRAALTPYHQLVPPGAAPEESRDDRRTLQVLGTTIERPERVASIKIEIDANTSARLDSNAYAPLQTLDGNILTLTGVPRDIPSHISDLVALVHHSLVYDESFNATDVDEIMANRRGDCTEFTDLFHHKAEDAGIETRKILGLAYLDHFDGRPSGFYVHAWNQVRIDDQWIDVDATWNQAPTSVLRIRFPQDAAQQIVLMRSLERNALRVVSVDYSEGAYNSLL